MVEFLNPIPFYFILQLNRKCQLCQEFLDIFSLVDPGHTDWWAITQFEAIQARSVQLQRDLEAGQIPVTAFKTALIAECKKPLPDVIRVLELEQNGSYLQNMGTKASKLFREIEDIIRFADFL